MIKNKIICLGSLLSLPVITLMCTSCGSNNTKSIEMIDILNYESKIEPYKTQEKWIDKETATSTYVELASKNNNIFKDDLYCSARAVTENRAKDACIHQGMELVEAICGVGDPTFGKTTSWIAGGEDMEYPTVSFKQKLRFVYQSPKVVETISKKLEFDIELEYHDMVFTLCEDILTPGGGWNIGFFDWNSFSECIWPIARNTNLWSINYSAKVVNTTIMHSEGQRPDIEVHNNSYYSGVINDNVALSNMLDPDYEATSQIELLGINFILLGEMDKHEASSRLFHSHYFRNVVYKPDVRTWMQITGAAYINDTRKGVWPIRGLQLIFPENMKEQIGKITYNNDAETGGVTLHSDDPIILTENDWTNRQIVWSKNNHFFDPEAAYTRKRELIALDFTYAGDEYTEEGTIGYKLNKPNLSFDIHYKDNGADAIETVETTIAYENIFIAVRPS